MKQVYLPMSDINLILEALQYAAEQVEDSCGTVAPFLAGGCFANDADKADAMLRMAQESRRLHDTITEWEGYGEDCLLATIK